MDRMVLADGRGDTQEPRKIYIIWQRDAAVSFENDPANWEGLLRETARERFAGHIH